MVTQIKTPKTASDKPATMVRSKRTAAHASESGARPTLHADANPAVEDAAYSEHVAPSTRKHASTKSKYSGLLARGKDLVSGDASSVATAAAIVVGAALIEVELIPGLIIGAGAILLGKLFPEMSGYVRPAIKGALRAGFSVGQKAREIMAETSEQMQDLVAEVKHEQTQPHNAKKAKPKARVVADSISTAAL